MRLLVYPHDLSIGGSQINAIDLAAGAAAAGHDVSVYGIPGPLVDYITERGLTYIPAPNPPLSPCALADSAARNHCPSKSDRSHPRL